MTPTSPTRPTSPASPASPAVPGLVAVRVAPTPGAWLARIPGWALVVGALVAFALVAVAAWAWSRPDAAAAERAGVEASRAAEQAVVAVLAYDYRTLEADQREAESHLSARYRREHYAPLWATVKKNAPTSQTVITASVVGSGVVEALQDRVTVLVLVDRPTRNTASPEPVVYRDHVEVTMVRSGRAWVVDGLRAS